MRVEIKDLDKIQKELIISLGLKDMESYLEKTSRRLAENMKVKGFREGNVPRKMVESALGKDRVWQEAANEALQDIYWDVVNENKINPIGMPNVEVVKFVPGQDVEFKAIIPVIPVLELPDYKAIAQKVLEKEKKPIKVDEKEVESSLKWLQNSRTRMNEEGKAENPPQLNDEFAKSVGNFENLESLKKSIREGISEEKKLQEKERLHLVILEKIHEKTDFKIPDFLTEQELDKMQEEFSNQVASMGLTLEKYLEQAKKDIKEVRKEWGRKAQERISSSILLKLIADKEGIEANPEDVEKEANKYLGQFESIEEAQKKVSADRLRAYISGIIKNEKVFEFLEGKINEE